VWEFAVVRALVLFKVTICMDIGGEKEKEKEVD
jgi:hypothetical protein